MAAVVVMVLTGIDHVESTDPEGHRGGKQQDSRIERPTHRNPSRSRSDAEREAKKKMRPARKALAVGIQKNHGQWIHLCSYPNGEQCVAKQRADGGRNSISES